jgi:hypothetical protein
MPGYKKSMYTAPKPEEGKETLEKRFISIPRPTNAQIGFIVAFIALFLLYAPKKNRMSTFAFAVSIGLGLAHMYDHLFLTQRGEEKFAFGRSEGYCSKCGM